jgi:hypothetical protein
MRTYNFPCVFHDKTGRHRYSDQEIVKAKAEGTLCMMQSVTAKRAKRWEQWYACRGGKCIDYTRRTLQDTREILLAIYESEKNETNRSNF